MIFDIYSCFIFGNFKFLFIYKFSNEGSQTDIANHAVSIFYEEGTTQS